MAGPPKEVKPSLRKDKNNATIDGSLCDTSWSNGIYD
jgi:hypothetical protein